MTRTTFAEHAWPALAIRGKASLRACLDQHLAIGIPDFLPIEDCKRYLESLYRAREDWTSAFGGEQFSLGRAWYTDLEEDRSQRYFAEAAQSNRLVEQHLPGMQEQVRTLGSDLVGAHVKFRPGWCGPGVHVFPAGEAVAERGGVVHFDTEGLADPHIEAGKPAISLIIMLQPGEKGGGTRVWDVAYDGCDEMDEPDEPGSTIFYKAGDLTILDSYRLHQIQPFSGSLDRVSITAMMAEVDEDEWEIWF